MSEQQLETSIIMTIVSLGLMISGLLLAVVVTLRAKRRRETEVNTIREEMINPEKRKNGKH